MIVFLLTLFLLVSGYCNGKSHFVKALFFVKISCTSVVGRKAKGIQTINKPNVTYLFLFLILEKRSCS